MTKKFRRINGTDELVHSVHLKNVIEGLKGAPKEAVRPLNEIVILEWIEQLPDDEITDVKTVKTYGVLRQPSEQYMAVDGKIIVVRTMTYCDGIDFVGTKKQPIEKAAANLAKRVQQVALQDLLEKTKTHLQNIRYGWERYNLDFDDRRKVAKFYGIEPY